MAVDSKIEPNHLAFYSDVIGELPQRPTTCFSRSPTVIPMWAHYAQSMQGFVIEFDENCLSEHFPNSIFNDIEYRDTPNEDTFEWLHHASVIGKPRYIYFLQNSVFSAAYFSKATSWSYEHERRMVVNDSAIRLSDESSMLIDVPKDCIKALICGPKANTETIKKVRKNAQELGCNYYEMKIGKGSVEPFFSDLEGNILSFNDVEIIKSSKTCRSCKEPLVSGLELCSWCRIEDSHREHAAQRNIFRVLADRNLLSDYLDGMDEIGSKNRKN
ncbi:DUF2971 domain-containing protein [Polynucleobacter sp. Ross1-W9]|nr:DUF2971 domain-containing protein [Polynucleobacter parvulilacunae]